MKYLKSFESIGDKNSLKKEILKGNIPVTAAFLGDQYMISSKKYNDYLKIYKWSFPLNGIRSAPNYDLEHTFPYFIDGLRFSEEPPYSNMEIEDAFAKELEMAANNYFVENRINFFKF